jgi:hypothetical protein
MKFYGKEQRFSAHFEATFQASTETIKHLEGFGWQKGEEKWNIKKE